MASNAVLASRLQRRHSELCFQRAFPCSESSHRGAVDELTGFAAEINAQPAAVRHVLNDSGIAGTTINYRFSFDVALWLARKSRNSVCIDWSELDDPEPLDALLRYVLQPAEDEYFDSGYVSTKEWIDIASTGFDGTDFDWLMAQLQDKRCHDFYRQLFDAAELPLAWETGAGRYSKSRNVFQTRQTYLRDDGMRARPGQVKKEIARPLDKISRLSGKRGAEMLDVAIASLAARHRETYHFNFANAEEVYLADVGHGIAIAVFGLLPEHRFPLECTMGYLILSNGVPIGYGGSSVLFKQVNTGINIFDEYRGSEAAYLWVQVMRVYHALAGCTRYVANPYQLGSGNSEALRSGAFWFYYRLGYRPVDQTIRELARAEQAKIERASGYRSNLTTLKRLASCDMHLTLPAARQHDFFDEEWLSTSSGLATQVLGRASGKTRQAAANRVARQVAANLGVRSLRTWTREEKSGLRALAPFIAALGPSNWTKSEQASARKLLRAKGSKRELNYARRLAANDHFLQAMRAACQGL